MAKIIPVKKYDIETDKFSSTITRSNIINSLSYVKEEYTSDENDQSYEYIIFANGYRVKDIALDGKTIHGNNDFTKRIINYFKKKNKNVVVIHILVDSDAPLDLESRMIARKIEALAKKDTVRSINLIGHSKCGVMFFNMPKYFKDSTTFEKSSIYTSAAPFRGCLIATPKLFLKQVKHAIFSKLPKPFNELTYNALKNYYQTASSNSHMDNDIALPGTVINKYDPNFIKRTFDRINIEAIKRVKHFHNFVTGIDENSLLKALKRRDYTGVGLYLMDKYFMDETTDGFIERSSQESISKYLDVPTRVINSAAHNYLAYDDELIHILDTINQNIDEDLESQKSKQLRR